MPNQNLIPLSRLASEIAPLIDGQPPSYRALADRVRSGLLPVEMIAGRYYAQRADMSAIVQVLGLPLKAGAPAQVAA